MDAAKFKKLPIMGIVRGIDAELVEPLVECVVDAGLGTLEITMNTPRAEECIKRAVRAADKRIEVGAGTVTDKKALDTALSAGASFIVMPVLVKDVVSHCVKNSVPVFPGALTPQEIFDAWNAGATMVKVFPSGFFGPAYFKEIKGPFNDIELLACGGVTPENMRAYLDNGASAVTFGASVFKKEWLAKKDFQAIGHRIKEYVAAFKK